MIKEYFLNLNEREKLTLVIGSVVLGAYLFYSLLYSPTLRSVHFQRQQLIEQQETLHWMKSIQNQPQKAKNKKNVNSGKLLSVLNQQLQTPLFKPFPFQLQQVNTNDLQLGFTSVPFTDFMVWLWKLNSDYRIHIHQLNIHKLDTAGLVKITLIVQGLG